VINSTPLEHPKLADVWSNGIILAELQSGNVYSKRQLDPPKP
jgi:hypothetical protein